MQQAGELGDSQAKDSTKRPNLSDDEEDSSDSQSEILHSKGVPKDICEDFDSAAFSDVEETQPTSSNSTQPIRNNSTQPISSNSRKKSAGSDTEADLLSVRDKPDSESLSTFFRKREGKQKAAGQPFKMVKKKKKTGIEQLASTMSDLNDEMKATRKFMKHEATKAERAIPIFMKEFKHMEMKDQIRIAKILKDPLEATVFLSLEGKARAAWVESFLDNYVVN